MRQLHPFFRCGAKLKVPAIYGDFELVSFIPLFGALEALSQWHAVQLHSDVRLAHVRNSVTHSCIIMLFAVSIVKGACWVMVVFVANSPTIPACRQHLT